MDDLQNGCCLGLDCGLHHELSGAIHHGDGDAFFVNVHAHIFEIATHLGCSSLGNVRGNNQRHPCKLSVAHSPEAATLTILSLSIVPSSQAPPHPSAAG